MIAKLSDELIKALQNQGDQPLTVEDPHTRRLYVVVPVEQFQAASDAADGLNEEVAWTEVKNARRFALIEKDIAGRITPEEATELQRLQHECDACLRQVAPLPFAELEALHGQLIRKSSVHSDTPES